MNIQSHMIHLARAAMQQAYSPYSKFKVGACLRTEDDEFFCGCNIENVSYSLTLCAESAAISALITAGYRNIKEVAIACSGNELISPCGACRQRLVEFANPNTIVHLSNAKNEEQSVLLSDLLPSPFNDKHLRSAV